MLGPPETIRDVDERRIQKGENSENRGESGAPLRLLEQPAKK